MKKDLGATSKDKFNMSETAKTNFHKTKTSPKIYPVTEKYDVTRKLNETIFFS